MAKSEIALLSAAELKRRLERRELSPVEVVEACLQQVERFNPRLNAIVTLNERALEEARELEKRGPGADRPLYGLPVGIKDVTEVAGLRTTYGSPLYADHVPQEDAWVVQRLREAGAIILGKTNTPEFAAGGHTFNEVFGPTRNPWNPDLSPGGSTGGGAAALATGMIALAQGTDLGGSLRIPASFCGIVGLRPSPGLVATYPSDYLWDVLQVSGPMARTAEDVALMLQAISGPCPRVPVSHPPQARDFVAAVRKPLPEGTRIAYCRDIAGIGVDASIESVCRAAAFDLQQAGATVEEIDFDLSFAREPFLALRGYWMMAHHLHRLDQLDELGENVAGNIRLGLEVTTRELAAAERARNRLWLLFHDFFQKYDYLLTPTMAVPPFPVEQNFPDTIAGQKMKTYIDWIAPTFVISMTGLPAGSVPCGLDETGLPVGMQVIGPRFGEERVLRLMRVIQERQPIGAPEMVRGD